MAPSRRDFLKTGACALGGMALASSLESFGIVHALTPQAATSYRALVCVFLNGGNDGNNTVVDLNQYNSYATARGVDLAIPQANLLAVSPAGGGSYGFHPNLTQLRDLFNLNKLAVVSNVGPLVEPLTKATYLGSGKKPLQLFSHSDQVGLFQTAISNVVSQTGWAGRVADSLVGLNGSATFPQNISIAGINLLLTGVNTRQLAVADSNTTLANVLQLIMTGTASEVSSRTTSFNELRNYDRNFTLIKAASDTRTSAIQTDQALSNVNPILTTVFPNTSLGRQLLQVARLIKASTDPVAGINMKRQIFFCQIGGFDTHSGQNNGQGNLLTQVSAAMRAFYDATVELGVANNVTTFTLSDFSRTLQPAGSGAAVVGSDHAWGNHHFVMGGAVSGGNFFGTYPTLVLGGPDDTNNPGTSARGRWIPTLSVEQYAATLATWYGLPSVDLPAVFPLIGRFSSPTLPFMT